MIEFMRTWCEGIIVAVMLSIIIEMLLPEGNNKKYIKVVIGIFILFVIINPVLEKINKGFELTDFLEIGTIEVSTNLDTDIKDVYIAGIEENIKKELIEKGYFVQNINVIVDKNYENIESIEVDLSYQNTNQNVIQIEKIEIGKNVDKNEDENTDLKKFLSENYKVSIDKIYLNFRDIP